MRQVPRAPKEGTLMNADQLKTLVELSADLQHAHTKFRAAGREDICQLLRKAGWQVAAAIADLVPDLAGVEVTS
jgi:hypothetical protein